MRRDLVEAVLDAASGALFEDVIYTPSGGVPVMIENAIDGVEIGSERFEMFSEKMRHGTHVTRALKALFPNLAKGDIINDGIAYKVIDWEPIGDGRFEIAISLKVA